MRSVLLAGASVAALFVVAPPAALAAPPPAGSGHTVQLVEVNSTKTDAVQVVFRYDGPASDVSKVSLTEDGKPKQTDGGTKAVADAKRDTGLMIVLSVLRTRRRSLPSHFRTPSPVRAESPSGG